MADIEYESQSLSSTTKVIVNEELIKPMEEKLVSTETPLPERFRIVFTLRNLGGPLAISALSKAFGDDSVLLKHEIAYCLGQMQDPVAVPVLKQLLEDANEHPIVRHEAGEALGAIATEECLEIVERFINDPAVEVQETCQIAAERIKWILSEKVNNPEAGKASDVFYTVDPAPALEEKDYIELGDILADENQSLFHRYRALFTLRDMNNDDGVKGLLRGCNATSALLRHEIAYVLGQLSNPISYDGLKVLVENSSEHPMVRHEAAEAIGALPVLHVEEFLGKFLNDPERIVNESCKVALDISDYYQSDSLEYADGVVKGQEN